MIVKVNGWGSSNFNTYKAEKYNGWTALIGIISIMGEYTITRKIIPEFSTPSKY